MTRQLIYEVNIAINSFLKSILDLTFPNSCQNCEALIERDELLCQECLSYFKPLASCVIGNGNAELTVFSRFLYSDKIKFLIQSKYSQSIGTLVKASKLLSLCQGFEQAINSLDGWVIVPVPLHWTRQLNRGFNQAQILAKGLSKSINAPIVNALYRKKQTKFQASTQTKTERSENVSNAFDLNTLSLLGRTKKKLLEKIDSKGIILVDDLLTTGATLLECAKILKKELNPKTIIAVTLCRS